jgi:DNA helicase-2/ATP-dependent DNA helicase PcrA
LKSILNHQDKTWLLQVISTFFDFIKDESNKKPDIKIAELLQIIEKMKVHEIEMPVNKILHSDKGINFITAHSAKGLEFNKVFIIGASKTVWDKNTGNFYSFSFPDTLNADTKGNDEDERRLFFVAMTRAKRELYISYSEQNENGKKLEASQFVTEILESKDIQFDRIELPEDEVNKFQLYTLLQKQKSIQLIDHDLIDKVLSNLKLSVTALNKYLKCPVAFYFDNILRVPGSRNKYMGFGRAIHRALQFYFEELKRKQELSLTKFLEFFYQGMRESASHFTDQEKKDLTDYGELILTGYYSNYLENLKPAKDYQIEIKLDKSEYEGIPLKGVLDLVEIYDGFVEVVDYKTGDYTKSTTKAKLKSPDAKQENGGDYWRQMVFYKMLLDSDTKHNFSMHTGYMDFVEPDKKTQKYQRSKIVVSDDDIKLVGEQIKQVWADIHEHKFEGLCEDEHCNWCDFVRNDYVFNEDLNVDRTEDDQELMGYA